MGLQRAVSLSRGGTICCVAKERKHMAVDAVDLRMLRELQADPSRPRMALAERVNLSPKYR
jgi:hypothetical protein